MDERLIPIFLGFFINFCFYMIILQFVNEDNFENKKFKKFVNYFFLLLFAFSLVVSICLYNLKDNFIDSILYALGGLIIFFFPTGIYFGIVEDKWEYLLNVWNEFFKIFLVEFGIST